LYHIDIIALVYVDLYTDSSKFLFFGDLIIIMTVLVLVAKLFRDFRTNSDRPRLLNDFPPLTLLTYSCFGPHFEWLVQPLKQINDNYCGEGVDGGQGQLCSI